MLASGDPFLHGVGATLARHVPVNEMLVLPAPSAFSLAASRLAWPLQATDTVSLHGHAIDLIRPLLHPRRRVLALTSDGDGPKTVAGLLTILGFQRLVKARPGGAGRTGRTHQGRDGADLRSERRQCAQRVGYRRRNRHAKPGSFR